MDNSIKAPAFRPLFFNPGQLDPEQIASVYIARRELFQNLLSDVLAARDDAAPQHHIIIGQRGMGKTTLLHRLAMELNKSPHSSRFIPLTFPEEQHVLVERLSDFWLNALDALATALDLRKQHPAAQSLDRTIRELPLAHAEEKDLANACRRELSDQCGTLGVRPVLLLDNFPLLLRKLENYEWDLRSVLQAQGAPIFVAAGLALPESLGQYDAAFLDMFKARVLYNLSLEECREIYQTMAKREGRSDVIAMMARHEGRLKTLHILTGGNPRTVGLLYELFARGLGRDAWEDLRSLLDTVTPLYQSRLEQLSEKGQQIFAALALAWEPIMQQAIESQTRLPQGTVSSTLLRLEESGVAERVDLFGEKKLGWQVAERFFNIWFLMRFASRRTQGSIAALASFLEVFYSTDELQDIARDLSGRRMDSEHAHYGLAVSRALGNSSLSRELSTHAQIEILRLREEIGSKFKDLFDIEFSGEVVDFFELRDKILPSLVPKDSDVDPVEFARCVVSSISMLPLRTNFRRDEPLNKTLVAFFMDQLRSEHDRVTSFFDEAAACEMEQRLFRGLLTDPENEQQWADAVESTNRVKTAELLEACIPDNLHAKESACRKCIALDESDPTAWFNLGFVLQDKPGRYKEAETAYRKAIALNEVDATPWNNLGNLLQIHLNRNEEAEAAYRKAIEIDANDAALWCNLGSLLQRKLNRYDEAEAAYRKAIKIDENDAAPWFNLGNLLQNNLNRYEEAEAAYRKAIEIDKNDARPWCNLGNLLQNKLNRYDEAEVAYRKAIMIDENDAKPWINLGNLLQRKLNRYDEAEVAFRKAIELDEIHAGLWNSLGSLFADYLHKPNDAETCYRKVLELEPGNEAAEHNLIFLLRDQLDRAEEAETLLRSILSDKSEFPDVLNLHIATFALRKENFGEARIHLRTALGKLGDQFKPNSTDDWYRTVAVWLDLKQGDAWLTVMEETGAARLFLPFFEAVRAHHLGDIRFLNNIPKEVQPTAREIFQEIQRRRKNQTPPALKPPRKKRRKPHSGVG